MTPPADRRTPEDGQARAPLNRASNGYWIHDAFGPRHYVAPDADRGPGGPPPDVIAKVFAALRQMPGMDISRLHLAVEGAELVLAGIVATDEDRRRATDAAAAAAPGIAVADRLTTAG